MNLIYALDALTNILIRNKNKEIYHTISLRFKKILYPLMPYLITTHVVMGLSMLLHASLYIWFAYWQKSTEKVATHSVWSLITLFECVSWTGATGHYPAGCFYLLAHISIKNGKRKCLDAFQIYNMHLVKSFVILFCIFLF